MSAGPGTPGAPAFLLAAPDRTRDGTLLPPGSRMTTTRRKLGSLDTLAIDALGPGAKPSLAVILCHGVNAPGDDLAGLGAEALEMEPQLARTTRFYFPAGLLDSAEFGMPGGRAWWEIDWGLLQQMMLSGDYSPMRRSHPRGLVEARQAVWAMLETVCAETGLAIPQVVLGGFSQGAMLCADLALRLPANPAALCLFSATLINEAEWQQLAHARKGLRVLQSHGRQDPLLPFSHAEVLRDLLKGAGAEVEFVPFAGQHGIGLEALQRFVALLKSIAAGKK